MWLMIILTIIFFIIDIISKIIVSNILVVKNSVVVIKNFFYITYVKNTGAAWSLFAGERNWLILGSIVIIIGIVFYLIKKNLDNKIEKIGYALILGGSLGNLYDRIVYGYVRDFLDFNIFGYDYPIFNLADSFIFIGVFMLIIYTWRCGESV